MCLTSRFKDENTALQDQSPIYFTDKCQQNNLSITQHEEVKSPYNMDRIWPILAWFEPWKAWGGESFLLFLTCKPSLEFGGGLKKISVASSIFQVRPLEVSN